MASTPVTAPPPDNSSPPAPPSNSSSSTPTPASPPPPTSTSPPPSSSPPSPPPPSSQGSSPPPPSQNSPHPPPPSSQGSSPPPPSQNSPPPPSDASPPPPPSKSKSSSPSPTSSPSLSSPPPPPDSFSPGPTLVLSPPSPRSSRTPSSSRTHKVSSSSSSSTDSEVATAIYVGVAVGVVAIVLLAVLLVCFLTKKKKRSSTISYYGDPGRAAKAEYHHSGSWHHGVSPQPVVQGGAGTLPLPPGGTWRPPPPPPPVMNSSDMSSGNYSGSRPGPLPPPSPNIALGFTKSTFTYEELALATNGFSQANLLGQGGFGYVHKGVLPTGKEIAVKQLKAGSGQGEREFQAEVEIISRVHHRHLVSLVGYCIAPNQRMLVYEFVPNKTLEYHLHGKDRPTMDWPTRLKIALGSAKGLAYLHEDCHPRIIHRDIKGANILLDFKFEAQVADFGLAKLNEDTHTHVSTRVMGTFGYLAPEYASSGKLTEKSDVFSFGVMLLELITGKKPVDPTGVEDSLVDWARPLLQKALEEGDYDELVDPRLGNNYNPHEMARLAACGAASVRHSARRRPKMSQIVRALEGDMSLESLNEGMRPGQSSVFGSSGASSEYDIGSYNADMSRFRKMAFASNDFGSAAYSGPTSEYGLHASSSSSEFSREMEPTGYRRNPSRH